MINDMNDMNDMCNLSIFSLFVFEELQVAVKELEAKASEFSLAQKRVESLRTRSLSSGNSLRLNT